MKTNIQGPAANAELLEPEEGTNLSVTKELLKQKPGQADPPRNTTFDIVAGTDEQTLNALIVQIYTAVYPNLFKDTIVVGQLNVASVSFDINQAPVVNLSSQRQEVESYLSGQLENNTYGQTSNLSGEHRSKIIEMVTAATLGLSLPSIAVTINVVNQPAISANASISAQLNIQTSTSGGNNYLTATIMSATISIPEDPLSAALLQEAFIPVLIPYLNTNILSNIEVPALQFSSITVSLPVPVVQAPFLTGYSALGSTQPDVPAPLNWPSNCVFAGVDSAVLQSAAAIPFPLGPSEAFSWDIISGSVGAQLTAPTDISINSDGSISAQIQASAWAQLTLHTPWPLPNVDFGPDASATISATFIPSVVNQEVEIQLEGFPIPTFSFDWGIPGWINWLFYPLEKGLAAALNAVLNPLIGNIIKFPPISVYSLPTVSFTLAGQNFKINITNATTSSQNSFLIVSAQATVS